MNISSLNYLQNSFLLSKSQLAGTKKQNNQNIKPSFKSNQGNQQGIKHLTLINLGLSAALATTILFTAKRSSTTKKELRGILNSVGLDTKGNTKQLIDRTMQAVSIDRLSRLSTKTKLLHDLKILIQTSKKQNTPFTVGMFDMDNFKSINDLLGYDTGDKFIRIIGETVKTHAEKAGYNAYRFGGEEFFILFPNTRKDDVLPLAEKIRKSLSTNKELNSYLSLYINNAQTKLKGLREYSQEYNRLKKIDSAMSYSNGKELKEIYKKYVNTKLNLLKRALAESKSQKEKKFLTNAIKNLASNSNNPDSVVELDNYLTIKYDRTFQISQIQLWLNSVTDMAHGKMRGFTITGGLKEFSPDVDLIPEDCIGCVGEIVKKGKDMGKSVVVS